MAAFRRLCSGAAFFALLVSASVVLSEPPCDVPHPLDPPNPHFAGQCPNCGMSRPMWARTWVSFSNAEGRYGVCSLHCLADISRKSGLVPEQVQVALYHSPRLSIQAREAFFVVGSKARGTMTKVSKLAFADREAAERFAAECGGKATSWLEAYSTALAGLETESAAITGMRLKKGKIVAPRDRVDECVICGMYPARYERNRSQLKTVSGKTVHFCSTQCLFKYLKDPRRYGGSGAEPHLLWVTGYASGRWVGARTAYYVIGSAKLGPMGYEAFAFDTRAAAEAFRVANGGSILPFAEVRIERILSSP